MAAKNKFMNAMKMPAIADMFSSEADRQRESGDLVTEVPLSELHPFVNHPFEVRDDEDMQKLVDSIRENGVLTNLTVRRRAEENGVTTHVGNILSSDTFYNADETFNERWQRMGILAVEMESAGLYATAAHAGVEALGMFTVSDSLVTGEATTAKERETAFTQMMELALPLAQI